MKILVISNNYPPYFDGISIFTNNLIRELKKKGNQVRQLNFDKEINKNLSIRDFFYTKSTLNSYYFPVVIFNPKLFSHSDKGFRNFVFTNLVERISNKVIDDYKPDIVHIMYPRLFSAVLDTKIPIVYSAYSEEIRNTFPVKSITNKASSIIAISTYTKKLLENVNNKLNSKTKVIPCSIETEMYMKGETIIRENYLISVGRLSKEKNFDTTIKAFSLLPKEIRDKYSYLIIGGGAEKDNLQNLINNLNLQDNVKLLGNIDEKDKVLYLKKSKYFILCPRIKKGEQEGFGIVYLEAQASSLPIITSKVGGIKEAVGDAGIYIDNPEDASEISTALQKLLSDHKLSSDLINKGLKRVKVFDHSNWIDQIIKVYKELNN